MARHRRFSLFRGSRALALASPLALGCAQGAAPAAPAPTAPARAVPAPAPALGAPQGLAYPKAPKTGPVETLHGVRVADPYRWLESLGSPETRAWLDAESAVTRRWLEGAPARERIGRQLAAALQYEREWPPKKAGSRYFTVRVGRTPQPVLYAAEGPKGEPRPVVDFNQISPDGKLGFAGIATSPRGTYVAYGLSRGGSDWVEWRVREVATGRDLPDRVEWTKYYGPAWAADEKGFYYSAFPKPAAGEELTAKDLGCAVRFHGLGAGAGPDPVVYERPDHPTWQFDLDATEDGRYLVITTGDGQVGDRGVEDVHVVDLAAKAAKAKPIVEGFDAEYVYVTSEGPTLFFRTTSGAPKRRVIAIDARNPARAAWKAIVPEGDVPLRGVARAGDRLVVETLVDVKSRLHAYKLDGRGKAELALPGVGTAYPVNVGRDERAALYVFTSYEAPATSYRHDFATNRAEPLRRPEVGVDPGPLETRQVFYQGKDGARIPMFVVHKKGLAYDGQNPTFLTGYGGGIVAQTPGYQPVHAWWLSVGGVLAVPGIRGGGEYGEAWARAAEKTKKQVTFDDFIAAAEWLVAQKVTSPRKLAVEGASGGGLLVAAAETQRPELFGAALVRVGVLDMLRFHLVGQGAGWQGFLGSPEVPEEFRALLAYSPVHNVRPGTRYPATMIVTGENDARVAPWHSYKFAAAMQDAQAGPAPILLKVEATSGHGGGTTLAAKAQNEADMYAFLAKELDMAIP